MSLSEYVYICYYSTFTLQRKFIRTLVFSSFAVMHCRCFLSPITPFCFLSDVVMVTPDGKLQCHIMRSGPRYLGTGLLDKNKVIQVS